MVALMQQRWWSLALRGLAAVVFGVLALAWPGITLFALVIVFGVYALVDGVFALAHAFSSETESRWSFALLGLLSIGIGIATLAWPGLSALALLYLIAAWAIAAGILQIAGAIQLRDEIDNEWLLGLGGVASVVLGLILLIWPGSGAIAMIWWIGAFAIFFGLMLIALGIAMLVAGGRPEKSFGGGNRPSGRERAGA